MDETQKRRLTAKEFIQRNSKIGIGIIAIFIALFIIYFSFIYFYSKNALDETVAIEETANTNSFIENLFPIFNETPSVEPELDSAFLNNFSTVGAIGDGTRNEGNDTSKIIRIENRSVLGYTIFDKSVSIKNYIKERPRICGEKLAISTKRDEATVAVKNFQNTLRSIEEYSDTPDTGVLDEKTREKIYIFQKRYAELLYKTKADKSPTRVIDKETVHFLNLLCGFDTENANDYVQIPTLRYVLKDTREIFDYNTESKEKVQIDSKTASGTEEVLFSDKGDYVVYRKSSDDGIITELYNVRTKNITRLERNISTLDFNSKNLLVYGVPTDNGITIKTYDEGKNTVKYLAQIPMSQWNMSWLNDNEIAMSNKPSAYAEGIYVSFNITTKKLRHLAGPFNGLAVRETSPGDFSILSLGGAGDIKTLLLNNKTKAIGDLGIRTFAEKCSETIFADGIFCAVPREINKGSILPDDWYKGKISTQDILVYKSISGTTTIPISYLENKPISMSALQINKNGIFFIDDKTGQLYTLQL
jgi:hypothetical protein